MGAMPLPARGLDRRTAAHRHVSEVKERLRAAVGGEPDAAEAEIIERLAMLSLQISQMDRRITEGAALDEKDSNIYLNCTDAFCRILKLLPQRNSETVNA